MPTPESSSPTRSPGNRDSLLRPDALKQLYMSGRLRRVSDTLGHLFAFCQTASLACDGVSKDGRFCFWLEAPAHEKHLWLQLIAAPFSKTPPWQEDFRRFKSRAVSSNRDFAQGSSCNPPPGILLAVGVTRTRRFRCMAVHTRRRATPKDCATPQALLRKLPERPDDPFAVRHPALRRN
jgi:hypothetical protein